MALALFAALGAGCVNPAPLELRRCPCAPGFDCCDVQQICLPQGSPELLRCRAGAGEGEGEGGAAPMSTPDGSFVLPDAGSPAPAPAPDAAPSPPPPDASAPAPDAGGADRVLPGGIEPTPPGLPDRPALDSSPDTAPDRPPPPDMPPPVPDATGVCLTGCDEGQFHAASAGLVELAAGGDAVWYHDGARLWRLAIASRQLTEPHPIEMGKVPAGELAADPAGAVYWCRRDPAVIDGAPTLMKNAAALEPWPCDQMRLTATHLYFTGNVDVRRRALAAGPAATVAHGIVTAFDVDATHVYKASRARAATEVARTPLADPTVSQPLFSEVIDPATSVVTDGAEVYFAAGKQILRVPAAGGTADLVSEPSDRTKSDLVLTTTHLYWTSTIYNVDTGNCLTTTVYRRARGPGAGAAQELTPTAYGAACPVTLAAHGNHLYLGLAAARDNSGRPGRIIRIRQ